MIKKLLISTLTCLSITNGFANTFAVKAPQISSNEEVQWTIATKDDGYYQLLGLYDERKFTVQVSPLHNNTPSDVITVDCNAGNGAIEHHNVAPGTSLTCYPHFHDVIAIYINPETFKNGAEGSFIYESYP